MRDSVRIAMVASLALGLISCHRAPAKIRNAAVPASEALASKEWPSDLPVYDHVLIVVEENKNYEQIIGNSIAPYLNDTLRKEGANLTRMFAEEHFSQGNYFWLFSGSNHNVGFLDSVPRAPIDRENLGHQLISSGHSFAGYAEGLPTINSKIAATGHYARKHVPWISFSNLPQDSSPSVSCSLRFPEDFPSDYDKLPTVSFVIPNLIDDMHDGGSSKSIKAGDEWLSRHINSYYQWAKNHNSLLIVTFDEDGRARFPGGLTDPASASPKRSNRIPTILAGEHIKHGDYVEGAGADHVTILRTLEAMYRLKRSGKQQVYADKAGIKDDAVIMDIFERVKK